MHVCQDDNSTPWCWEMFGELFCRLYYESADIKNLYADQPRHGFKEYEKLLN